LEQQPGAALESAPRAGGGRLLPRWLCRGTGTAIARAAAGPWSWAQPLVPAALAQEQLPRLWDLSGRELHQFILPGAASARCGTFAPDEKVFFTGGTDK